MILSERFVSFIGSNKVSSLLEANRVAFSVGQKCWFLISECVNIQIYSKAFAILLMIFFVFITSSLYWDIRVCF